MTGMTLKRFSASPLSVLLSITLLLQVTVTVISGQENNVPMNNPHSLDVWKCVPYYLCNKIQPIPVVITNGAGLIDERTAQGPMSDKGPCPSSLELWCSSPLKEPEPENYLDKVIWEFYPPPPSKPVPCKCVPIHKCADKRNKGPNSLRDQVDIRGNQGYCKVSVDVCCFDQIEDSITPTPPPIINGSHNRTVCGYWNKNGVDFEIVGNDKNEAQYAEFPWVIAILKLEANQSTTYLGGGSLIHPNVVLTVAHSMRSVKADDLILRAGEWDTQTKDEPYPIQDRRAEKIIKHEYYDDASLVNDVALIFVTTPFVLGKNVGTLCLPRRNAVFDKKRCYATGWGQKEFGKYGENQVILKKIDLPVVPHDVCQVQFRKTRLGVDFILDKSFMCAGGEIGKDTCKGDGGSPLMCLIKNKPGQFEMAGMVAWGIGCNNESPGAYVNVPFYRHWIDDQMADKDLETSYYDHSYKP